MRIIDGVGMLNITERFQVGVLILGSLFSFQSQAVDLGNFGETSVSLQGYIKVDSMVSNYDSDNLSPNHVSRDFYIPSTIPLSNGKEQTVLDMHARQSRFAIKTKRDVEGNILKTYLELDFMVTPGGDERISNSYSPRMRHAFFSYGNWTYGQTWSTFMNVSALPDTLDFIGNTDATIFVRQPQIRYTNGPFQVSLENPETLVTPFGGGARIVTDDNVFPDMVLRYNYDSDYLTFALAGLARQLRYISTTANIDSSTSAYGLSFSGSLKIGQDDIKFIINTGSGLGRYIALNIADDAVINADGNLETIASEGKGVSYRHYWNNKWRSNIAYSSINVDNDIALTGTSVSKKSASTRINIIYAPIQNLYFGGEISYAKRELENGNHGTLKRLQFSTKLVF